jgi:phage tail-like protein
MAELDDSPFVFPPLSFYFKVEVDGIRDGEDLLFSEASGFSSELEMETSLVEGGNNNRAFPLPKRVKFNDLVLKRGMVAKSSPFHKWCEETINTNYVNPVETKTVVVNLLDESGTILIHWRFVNALPKKLEVSALNANASGDSAIMLETVTLTYSEFSRGIGKAQS